MSIEVHIFASLANSRVPRKNEVLIKCLLENNGKLSLIHKCSTMISKAQSRRKQREHQSHVCNKAEREREEEIERKIKKDRYIERNRNRNRNRERENKKIHYLSPGKSHRQVVPCP